MKLVFISDIHLNSGHEPKARALISFLETLKTDGVTDLFLVGDIFDLWLSHHQYFILRYGPVVRAIKKVCEEDKIQVHYFEGNHDLYLKNYWSSFKRLRVYEDSHCFQFGDQVIRVEHGDMMNPDDRGYLFLRWFLRTPALKWLGRSLPGATVGWIGDKASHKSREYTSTAKKIEKSETVELIRKYSERAFEETPYDLMVTGHVHTRDDYQVQQDHEFRKGRSVNLGTWLDIPYVFEWSPESSRWIELEVAKEG